MNQNKKKKANKKKKWYKERCEKDVKSQQRMPL